MNPFEQILSFADRCIVSERGRVHEGGIHCPHEVYRFLSEVRVDLPPYTASTIDEHLCQIRRIRRLLIGLQHDCSRLTARSEFDMAACYSAAILDLGRIFRRGGLVLDLLVSIGIARSAIGSVRKIRRRLSPSARRVVIDAAERIERDCDPLEVVLDRDHQWEIANSDVEESWVIHRSTLVSEKEPVTLSQSHGDALVAQMMKEFLDQPQSARDQTHTAQFYCSLALVRLLKTDLAIRSFQQDRMCCLERLEDLLECYLNEVPIDPFTSEPFCYRRIGLDDFALYSVGPCRVDHGGTFGGWHDVIDGNADLCLDMGDYDFSCQ
jgi:hypothetical protein